MSLELDVYWSFRSPYSYLATGRLVALHERYDVHVNVKIVLPIAVRKPEFFDTVNPLWPPYLMRDTQRIAEQQGIPYRWPRPDPIVQNIATREIASEQPYIWRLSRLGMEASDRGCGLPFIDEVSQTIWSGRVDGWHEGEHLAQAAARAGLDLAEMEETISGREADYDRRLAEHDDQLKAAGHWGVPTFVFEGEPFFGQDRLDLLEWRMKQRGLSERR